MAIYQVISHAVAVSGIVSVEPLVANSKLLSPEVGLTLVLEDTTKHNWVAEKGGVTPVVGDVLVRDEEMHVTFVVSAETFRALFREA